MTFREMRIDREREYEIRERIAAERHPEQTVDGDYTELDDDDTQCIDGAGNAWPEHDESGYTECRRCGAELEVPN